MGPSTVFGKKIFPLGRAGGVAHPSVNLGPPHISDGIIARKVKFYTYLASIFYLSHYCILLPRLLWWRIYGDPLVAPSFPVFSRCTVANTSQPRPPAL